MQTNHRGPKPPAKRWPQGIFIALGIVSVMLPGLLASRASADGVPATSESGIAPEKVIGAHPAPCTMNACALVDMRTATPAPKPSVTPSPDDQLSLHGIRLQFLPDLTASLVDPVQEPDGTLLYRFAVTNIGTADAGPFRVAVLSGPDSFSRSFYGLNAGQSSNVDVPNIDCNQGVFVIVDADSQVQESNEQNNTLSFQGWCKIDNGSQGNPGSP